MALSSVERTVMEKMEAVGTPLKEWDISIYRGITTGLNDAFVIDNKTKEALVEQDPRSAEIITPVLRGRDIARYRANWAGLWLISTFPSLNVNINKYPCYQAPSSVLWEGTSGSGRTSIDRGRTLKEENSTFMVRTSGYLCLPRTFCQRQISMDSIGK